MLSMGKINVKICRLCGKEKPRGTNVFTDNIKGAVLVSIINKYFPKEVINVSPSDSFPKYVCIECEQKICTFDEFCLMVANVQKQLAAPSLEIDFAEDMLCHLKEDELDLEKKPPGKTVKVKKKHICNQCSKSFKCLAHLKRHMRIHTGHRPFVCNICRMTFNQKEILIKHRESHEAKKEFKCGICMQSFRFKVSLTSHMLNYHSEIENGDAKSYHSCSECGKSFATKYKLQRHVRCHTGERPFACNFCKKTFSQTGNLKFHEQKCRNAATTFIENTHFNNTDQVSIVLDDFSNVFMTESDIQKTINETINSSNEVYLKNYEIDEEIETILDRDLAELNGEIDPLKKPDTPELFHTLLYDV